MLAFLPARAVDVSSPEDELATADDATVDVLAGMGIGGGELAPDRCGFSRGEREPSRDGGIDVRVTPIDHAREMADLAVRNRKRRPLMIDRDRDERFALLCGFVGRGGGRA